MCDGLARKHRLGLSDEDVRQEMLARFRLRALESGDQPTPTPTAPDPGTA